MVSYRSMSKGVEKGTTIYLISWTRSCYTTGFWLQFTQLRYLMLNMLNNFIFMEVTILYNKCLNLYRNSLEKSQQGLFPLYNMGHHHSLSFIHNFFRIVCQKSSFFYKPLLFRHKPSKFVFNLQTLMTEIFSLVQLIPSYLPLQTNKLLL